MMRVWHSDLQQIGAALPALQQVPILLLWGSLDAAVYPTSAYELQNRLANSTVLMMEGVGHLPYEEVPQDFNRIVCDFFLRHYPQTPREIARVSELAGRIESPAAGAGPAPLPSHIAG